MDFEFSSPWALIAWPVCIAVIFTLNKRYPLMRRAWFSTTMRCILSTLLILALAVPSAITHTDKRATWVIVDGSDSAQSALPQSVPALISALNGAPDTLSTGIISFGRNAQVEAPLSTLHRYQPPAKSIDPTASHLSSALDLAYALLPSDAAGRIAVVSDGHVQDVSNQIDSLTAHGIHVDVYSLPVEEIPDAQVSALTLPSIVREGQSVPIDVTLDANYDTTGMLVIYANNTPIATREVTLRRGSNHFAFEDIALSARTVIYEAQLNADGDERTQNNRRSAFMRISGPARIALVEGTPGDSQELAKMFDVNNMPYDIMACTQLPDSAQGLLPYDAIVFNNVDIDNVTDAQMRALNDATRIFGRGFIVIGGYSSYAPGGYRGHAIEQMLPLTMDAKSKLDIPTLALMLVIDKSGSMSESTYGTTLMDLAKEAAIRATEVLTIKDHVGVIGFDEYAKWVVPMQLAEDLPAIADMIATLRPDGGTAYAGALSQAYEALETTQAAQKHIIFLSDGEPADGGFLPLIEHMVQDGITLTTVALGSGANRFLMSSLAQAGKGRFYAAGAFDNLPKIFAKETEMAAGKYIENRIFTPIITQSNALTDFSGFPTLSGYIATAPKPLATVSMVSDQDDPIVAHWRYGAGTVVCFTADAQGAWTEQFLSWDQASRFFTGLAAFALPTDDQAGELTSKVEANGIHVRYRQPEDAGDGLVTELDSVNPDGGQTTIALTETAPGTFETVLSDTLQGAYSFIVRQYDGGNTINTLEGGAVIPYSQEYDLRTQSKNITLETLAQQTGGRVLSDLSELFLETGTPARARTDLTNALLLSALILFLIDITLRRLLPSGLGKKEKKEKLPKKPIVQAETPAKATAPDTTSQLLALREKRKKL